MTISLITDSIISVRKLQTPNGGMYRMKCQPSTLRELEDGRWEFEEPAGSDKKVIYKTFSEANPIGVCKISCYRKVINPITQIDPYNALEILNNSNKNRNLI